MLLVGCSSLQGTGDKGFVSGSGEVVQVEPDSRDEPVSLTGQDLEGNPLSAADFRGKPVVAVVWGSWCAPCRAEAPDVVAAAKEVGDRAQFVGINIRDPSPAQARSFVRTFDVPYPSYFSPDGEAMLAFSGTLTPNSIPSFVVLDADGRVAASIIGELPSRTTLVEVVEDVVAEHAMGSAMGEWFHDTAASGSLLLAIPVALVAGLVSFFSPCVIPLLPGYLSYATGLSGADLENARRGRMMAGAVLFVLGFAVVFVALGTLSGALGAWLVTWRREITIVLGLFTILLGLAFAGVIPLLQRDWRVHSVPAVGLAAAPVLGFLFGVGWTPCIGPTLAAITTLSINEATAARGAVLSGVYALGLGLPFIAAGVAYQRALGAFGWVRRHQVWVMRAGGLMLVAVGVLLVTGWWAEAVTWLQINLVSSTETVV